MLRKNVRLACMLATIAALVFALPAAAGAMTVVEGNTVSVASGEIVSDDLYAFGNTITINGIVEGDVVAFGQIVVIGGEVHGSVISAAQTVRVDGTVDGSVRAGGAWVEVSGLVGGDVLAGANRVGISGDVARDLAAGAQTVNITGRVGRNVRVGSESLTIAGDVGGDVEAESNRVTVTSQGSVDGSLDYWSATEADVAGNVSGQVSRHEPPTRGRRAESGASGVARAITGAIIAWVQSFVGFLVLGVIMIFAARTPTLGGSQAAVDRPWPSLGVGLAVFFGTPVAAGFVFLIGLFIGAWWLSFVLMTVYWLLLLAGLVVGSLAIGRAILHRGSAAEEQGLVWPLVLGLVLVWIVAAVPVLGWFAAWVVMLAGTGALVLLWMGKASKPAAQSVAAEAAVASTYAAPPTAVPPPASPPVATPPAAPAVPPVTPPPTE